MDMTEIAKKVKEVIEEPIRHISKEEAKKLLCKYGILDKNGEITPRYKDIVIKVADEPRE